MCEKDKIRQTIEKRGGYGALNTMQETMLNCKDKNVVLLAPTGSGKTVAFLSRLYVYLRSNNAVRPALIIVPTRELAKQISEVSHTLIPEYVVVALYGGRPLTDDVNRLKNLRADILIATPGRLLDHMTRATVDMSAIEYVVIDEMDKCLELGFIPDIKRILRRLTSIRYLTLVSATMPEDESLISINGPSKVYDFTNGGIERPDLDIIEVPSPVPDKVDILINLLDSTPVDERTIIFVNHRDSAERLYSRLKRDGFPVALYHGGLEQQERELAVETLKNGSTPILIATDLASRGLDIPEVENVVHYHMPVTDDIYTHRNGRTARAGRKGRVYVIISEKDNRPSFLNIGREFIPRAVRTSDERITNVRTVLLNLGKKDKISRGDILGFLTKVAGLPGNDVGKIEVWDHCAAVALPQDSVGVITEAAKVSRIKNKRFRVSVV